MENYHDAVDKYLGAYKDIFTDYPTISPEDNAIVMFTSGKRLILIYIHLLNINICLHRYDWLTKGCIKYPTPVSHKYAQRTWSLFVSRSSIQPSYELQTIVGGRRALLRRGGNLPDPAAPVNGPQKGALIAVPLFHVTGTTSYTVRCLIDIDILINLIVCRCWQPCLE